MNEIDRKRPPTTDELRGHESLLFRLKRWLFMKLFYTVEEIGDIRYPQTWHAMPRTGCLRRFFQALCGWLGGHELSDTEFSWDGHTVMRNCRWCDRAFFLPPDDCGDTEKALELMRIMASRLNEVDLIIQIEAEEWPDDEPIEPEAPEPDIQPDDDR